MTVTDTSKARATRASEAPVALALSGVHHGYERAGERIEVLQGADLEVRSGELVAVVGRSGSGKSTLLHVAGGLVAPAAGSVAVGGRPLASLDARERAVLRRRTIGFVFQFFHLLPHLDVRDNVALPLLLDGARTSEALDLLVAQVRDRDVALVLVTHDAASAARADRTLHLLDGLLV